MDGYHCLGRLMLLLFQFCLRKNLFLFSILSLVGIQMLMALILSDLSGELVSLQLSFSPERFQQVYSSWSLEQQQAYRNHFGLDFVYPFAYGGFFCVSLAHLIHKNKVADSWIWVITLPLFAGIFDCIENVFHLLLLDVNPMENAHLVLVAAISASIKWGLLFATMVLIVLGLVAGFIHSKR